MNIKNFRGDFNYKILERGRLYLQNYKLKKITCDGKGNYSFIVSGTEEYTVTASISPDGELSGLSCDCPYDGGTASTLPVRFCIWTASSTSLYLTAVLPMPECLSQSILRKRRYRRRREEKSGLFRSLR